MKAMVLDKGGRLVINAIRKAAPVPPLDYAECLWQEKEIKSVANVTRQDAAVLKIGNLQNEP